MWDFLFSLIAEDIAIDLGTANTLIYVRGKGITIREPSIVARQKKTKEILAIGSAAKKMIGKTPQALEVIRPLKDGVIADFDATTLMLKKYLGDKIPKPRVVIGIPSGVTEVERRAVQDACLSAGARKCFLIEEPMAAAIGANLPIDQPEGMLVVDVGGGTTEIAVISLGGIVIRRCLRIAGDEMDEAIANFMRLKYSVLLGEATCEEIKIQLGSAYQPPGKTAGEEKEKHLIVRGRDLETGLPKSIKVGTGEIREAIAPIVSQILEAISDVIEETPPELVADIVGRGISLSGGGAQLWGLDKLIAETVKMPVWVVEDPLTVVVRGGGRLLEDESLLARVKVTGGVRGD